MRLSGRVFALIISALVSSSHALVWESFSSGTVDSSATIILRSCVGQGYVPVIATSASGTLVDGYLAKLYAQSGITVIVPRDSLPAQSDKLFLAPKNNPVAAGASAMTLVLSLPAGAKAEIVIADALGAVLDSYNWAGGGTGGEFCLRTFDWDLRGSNGTRVSRGAYAAKAKVLMPDGSRTVLKCLIAVE